MKAPFVPYVLIMLSCFCVYFPANSQGTIQRSEGRFLASLDFNPASGIYNGRKNRIQNSSNLPSFPDEYRESGIKVSGMVKAAVLTMEWWTLFGEPVENYNFQWTTSGRYQVYQEGGAGYTVERNKLAKYPDLLLRFDAIKPLDVKFVIYWRFDFDTYKRIHSSFSAGFNYNVTTNVEEGLLFEPSGKNPLSVPGIRKGKGENFIDKKFNNHQHYEIYAEAKKSWLQEFNQAKNITIDQFYVTSARWPVKEMLTIATLFEQYEKGEKKPSPMEEVQAALAKVEGTQPYTQNGYWSEPFEETKLNITLNLEGKTWIVRNNGNITYTDSNNKILQFKGSSASISNFLILDRPVPPGKSAYGVSNLSSIIDHRGTITAIDGITSFNVIWDKKNEEGYYRVTYFKKWTYVRDICYTAGSGGLGLSKIYLNKSFDEAKNKLLRHKDSESSCTQFGGKWSPYGISEFIIYYLNDNMQVVKRESEYCVTANYDYK